MWDPILPVRIWTQSVCQTQKSINRAFHVQGDSLMDALLTKYVIRCTRNTAYLHMMLTVPVGRIFREQHHVYWHGLICHRQFRVALLASVHNLFRESIYFRKRGEFYYGRRRWKWNGEQRNLGGRDDYYRCDDRWSGLLQRDFERRFEKRSRYKYISARSLMINCKSPLVSKGETRNLKVSPLLTRWLLHRHHTVTDNRTCRRRPCCRRKRSARLCYRA